MSAILVIGATGQIGQIVCRTLAGRGHKVRALVRDISKAKALSQTNLELFEGDLENDFSDAFADIDKVVFSAGSGSATEYDKTILVDLWGAKRAIDYAQEEPTVKHFIMVSSLGAHDPDDLDTPIKPYLIAKHIADEYLSNCTCSLPYTILRPGRLTTDADKQGYTSVRPKALEDMTISRSTVAEAICYCVEHDSTKIKVVELFKGHDAIERVLG